MKRNFLVLLIAILFSSILVGGASINRKGTDFFPIEFNRILEGMFFGKFT
jgi:hypothetical protein